MSQKIPWTDPGGAPCCCLNCPPDSVADNNFDFFTFGKGPIVDVALTEEQYANIAAGGTWNIESNISYSFLISWGDPRREITSTGSFVHDISIANIGGQPFPTSGWQENTTGISLQCFRIHNGIYEDVTATATETVGASTTTATNTGGIRSSISVRLYDINGTKSAKIYGDVEVDFLFQEFTPDLFFNTAYRFTDVASISANSFLGIPMTAESTFSLPSLYVIENISGSGGLVVTLSPSAP